MSALPDETLLRVLQAVQQKLASTQRELSSVEAQMEVCEREARAGELVNQELNQLSDDVRVYQSIGKMFLLSDLPTVKKDLDKKIQEAKSQISVLEKKHKYLKRSVEETAGNLRDIMHHGSS